MFQLKINYKVSFLEYLISNNISIPHYCYHSTLSIVGNCRVCLIELKGLMKPITPCSTDASTALSKTDIYYDSPFVTKARENILEFLLLNHPLDCPICDQGGVCDCDLQDQSMRFGFLKRRFYKFKRVANTKDLGPIIKTVMTRCIHCTRCVRFAKEINGIEELGILGRGNTSEIGTYVDKVLTSKLSGNVIDLCLVGTITFKDYKIELGKSPIDNMQTVLGLTRNSRNYNDVKEYKVMLKTKTMFYGCLYDCLSWVIFSNTPSTTCLETSPYDLDISIDISFKLTLEDDSIIESKTYSQYLPLSIYKWEDIEKVGDNIHFLFKFVEYCVKTFYYQTDIVGCEAGNIPKAKVKDIEILVTNHYLGTGLIKSFTIQKTGNYLKERIFKKLNFKYIGYVITFILDHFELNYIKTLEILDCKSKSSLKINASFLIKTTNGKCVERVFYTKEFDIYNDSSLLNTAILDLSDSVDFSYNFIFRRYKISFLEFKIIIVYNNKEYTFFLTSEGEVFLE